MVWLGLGCGQLLIPWHFTTPPKPMMRRRVLCAGLHGAKLAIMGRRQQVIQESAEKLQSEGLEAIGVQVTCRNLGGTAFSSKVSDMGHNTAEIGCAAVIAV